MDTLREVMEVLKELGYVERTGFEEENKVVEIMNILKELGYVERTGEEE